jgi:phosphopantetheinyl transferase (holo-ACP synthase)
MRLYANAEEQEAIHASELGPVGAAVRVWTTKEAVAKMLNVHLADAWARTHVLTIGDEHSTVRIKDGLAATVVHESVEAHLFALAWVTS